MFRISGLFQFSVRYYASPNRIKPFKKPKAQITFEAEAISLKHKGFLRSQRPYQPPTDVNEKVDSIVKELNVTSTNFKDIKFDFLNQCANTFNHPVPNSMIYEMSSIDNVIDFYNTPVDCQTPYEKLDKTIPNLHIIPEARRYNPETDGQTAFPRSCTLVTGLKYRKKYKGHTVPTSWPFV